jgi:hypothetical protein
MYGVSPPRGAPPQYSEVTVSLGASKNSTQLRVRLQQTKCHRGMCYSTGPGVTSPIMVYSRMINLMERIYVTCCVKAGMEPETSMFVALLMRTVNF